MVLGAEACEARKRRLVAGRSGSERIASHIRGVQRLFLRHENPAGRLRPGTGDKRAQLT